MNTRERKALGGIFFLYGICVIAWVPRFPELKQNLHLTNGQFGTILSLGWLGSIAGLLTVGHLVHRFGSRKMITGSSALMCVNMALIVHLTSHWQFLLCNILLSAGMVSMHISLTGQALHEQEYTKENIIPRMHGMWASGALTSAVLSGFLVSRVGLALHIDILVAIALIVILLLVKIMAPTLLVGDETAGDNYSLKDLFTRFKVDWLMSLGLTGATILEFSAGDWATIYSKENLHMSPGVSAIPYILFMFALIVGRLTVHRVVKHIDIGTLIKWSVIIGGAIFIVCLNVGLVVSKTSPTAGFVIFAFGTFIGGLGGSYLAPTIMNSANRRSSSPGPVVLGQIGLVQGALTLILKFVIAWIAQFAGIHIAFLLPAIMLMCVAFTARAVSKATR